MSEKNKNGIWQFSWSKWIIYFTVFLTPLYASMNHWYPFTTPKTLIIIGGTLLATTFFCWGLLTNKQESVRLTYLHWILFSFLAIMSLAGILGVNPHNSFFGTFFSSVSIVLLLTLGIFACLVSEFTRRNSDFLRRVLTGVFISGVIVAFISYLPLLGSKWQLLVLSQNGSTLGNSSFAGTFLLFVVGFGAYLAITARGWRKRMLFIVGLLVVLACPIFFNADFWRGTVFLSDIIRSPILASGEAQGALLGVLVSVFVAFSLWLGNSRKITSKVIGTVLLLVCAISITVGYAKLISPQSKVHQQFAEVKSGTRFVFWDIAQQAVVEKPVLGWGFENYQTVYQKYFDPIIFETGYSHDQWVTNPHNIVYDMAVSSGIIGLLGYMVLLGFVCIVFIYFARNKEGMT